MAMSYGENIAAYDQGEAVDPPFTSGSLAFSKDRAKSLAASEGTGITLLSVDHYEHRYEVKPGVIANVVDWERMGKHVILWIDVDDTVVKSLGVRFVPDSDCPLLGKLLPD